MKGFVRAGARSVVSVGRQSADRMRLPEKARHPGNYGRGGLCRIRQSRAPSDARVDSRRTDGVAE